MSLAVEGRPKFDVQREEEDTKLFRRILQICIGCPMLINPSLESLFIIYDISRPPSLITTPLNQPLTTDATAESAIFPPSLSLKLVSDFLPWVIVVTASSAKLDSYITVSDITTTLCRALHLTVYPADFDALPSHDAKRRVNTVYEDRCKRLEEDPRVCEEEKKKGVKRVDLMGRTMFMGLSPAGPGVWTINVS